MMMMIAKNAHFLDFCYAVDIVNRIQLNKNLT